MSNRPETLVLESPEISLLLKNMYSIFYLKPFFTKPQSLQEASNILGIAMSSYYYWIKKFLDLGLLTIAFKKQRAGSSIKYYITPAKKLIVKLDNGSISQKDFYDSYAAKYDLNTLVTEAMFRTIFDSNEDFGIMLYEDERGEFYTKPITIIDNKLQANIDNVLLAPNSPAVLATWRDMRLRYSDAKELQRKLSELLDEFDSRIVPEQKSYLIQILLAPER